MLTRSSIYSFSLKNVLQLAGCCFQSAYDFTTVQHFQFALQVLVCIDFLKFLMFLLKLLMRFVTVYKCKIYFSSGYIVNHFVQFQCLYVLINGDKKYIFYNQKNFNYFFLQCHYFTDQLLIITNILAFRFYYKFQLFNVRHANLEN